MTTILNLGSAGGLIVALIALYFAEPPNQAWARVVAVIGVGVTFWCHHAAEKRKRRANT